MKGPFFSGCIGVDEIFKTKILLLTDEWVVLFHHFDQKNL